MYLVLLRDFFFSSRRNLLLHQCSVCGQLEEAEEEEEEAKALTSLCGLAVSLSHVATSSEKLAKAAAAIDSATAESPPAPALLPLPL